MSFTKSFSRFFFSRSDSHAPEIRAYLAGLLLGRPGAKNMERMEEAVADFEYQRVHHSISTAPWAARPLMDEVARRADGLFGAAARTRLVVDETGIQKKGRKSVGVARQYLGRLGKVENGQVAVCTSLASGAHALLTDLRLYLPEAWCEDPARCEEAGIPEAECRFRTKAQLALESLVHQHRLGVRFDVACMDSGFGSDGALRRGLDQAGITFVAEIHCDHRLWTEAPWPHDEGARPGRRRQHPVPSHPGRRVDQIVEVEPAESWRRLKVRESDQGWVEVNWLARRVWVCEEGRDKLCWLLAWENPDEAANDGHPARGPRRHYALSNAPADEDARVLVADGVERSAVERTFRDGKRELGLADYQTRGWQAWHHHMALVMLLMLFLTQEKMLSPRPQTEEGPVQITTGDLTFLLERLLPHKLKPAVDEDTLRAMLARRLSKRVRDQVARRRKTRASRPPLFPDEINPHLTK